MAERIAKDAQQASTGSATHAETNEVTHSTVAPHRPESETRASEATPSSGSSSDSLASESSVTPPVSHEQIALLAYHLAQRRGFTPGHELDDWLEAERELADTSVTLARGIR
jgi:Protein of unknown function (DUF2934)